MRHLIQNLSRQDSVFLLTLFTLSGDKDLALLRFLPKEQAQTLSSIGRELAKTPRKELLPQLVQELKRLIADASRSSLDHLDPAWQADFLQDLPPRTIAVILQSLPRAAVQRVLQALPPQVASRIPPQITAPAPEVVKIVRKSFEDRIPTLPQGKPSSLALDQFLFLQGEEIYALVRELGFREMAIAFRNLGRGPIMELCRSLGDDAEKLLSVIRELPASTPREMKSAQRIMRAVSSIGGKNLSKAELILEAGIFKLRHALLEQDPSFLQSLAYRLPYATGSRLLHTQVQTLEERDQIRLRREALSSLHLLAQTGKIQAHWQPFVLRLPPLPDDEAPMSPPEVI